MKKHLLLLLPFGLLSCFAKKEVNSNTPQMKTTPKLSSKDCMTDYGTWKMHNINRLYPKTKDQKLPTIYTAFTIDERALNIYMLQLKKSGNKEIIIPSSNGCATYSLQEAGTMSPELAAQYPEIMSFKGSNTANPAETIRLDYDGTSLRASMSNATGVFLLDPFETKEGKYYLLFDAANSGIPKRPFEK